jgi:hypothetical protein
VGSVINVSISVSEIKSSVKATHVEQALGSISPWESLVSDAEILVLDELWSVNCHLLVFQVCVQHAQTDGWDGNEEGQAFPQLVASS